MRGGRGIDAGVVVVVACAAVTTRANPLVFLSGSALDVDDEVRSRAPCFRPGPSRVQQPAANHLQQSQPNRGVHPNPAAFAGLIRRLFRGTGEPREPEGARRGPLQGSGAANKQQHSRPTPSTAGFGADSQSAATGLFAIPANPDLPPAQELLVLFLPLILDFVVCRPRWTAVIVHRGARLSGLPGHGQCLRYLIPPINRAAHTSAWACRAGDELGGGTHRCHTHYYSTETAILSITAST